jgi:hypothetical protein
MSESSRSEKGLSRRSFLQVVVTAVPVAAAVGEARGAALPKLDPKDKTAIALLYVEDTTKVDKKNPMAARHTPQQNCANCAQIQGKAGDALRPCAIFPGKLVNARGWCSVWAKKP